MKIVSEAISNGVILDRYGKRGDMHCSLPLRFEDYPTNTITFALIIEDYDAIAVCGYCFTHWLVANLTKDYLLENESALPHNFIEGENDFNENNYGGMAPPDRPHTYDITVYALDCILSLEPGFQKQQLHEQMIPHILDKATIKGVYYN